MREIAAQGTPGDERVGHVVADRSDGGEQSAPARAASGQAPVGGVEGLGQRPVALDEEGVEAEDLHFLRRLHAGAGLADVVQLPPLRGPGVVEGVALGVEVRLAEEGGHERQDEQRDQPRRVGDQRGGEARDRHHVLGLAEELAHQGDPAHGLAPRAVEAVLELAVLEIFEVEGGRVLHETDARGVGEPLGEQRVHERDDAAEHVGHDGQRQLEGEQGEEVVDAAAGQPLADVVLRAAGGGQAHHLVDDQLADVERGHGKERACQPAREVGGGQAATRLPDQLQERREVAQRAEPLAKRAGRGRRGVVAAAASAHPRHGAAAHGVLPWHPLRMPRLHARVGSPAGAPLAQKKSRRTCRSGRPSFDVTVERSSTPARGAPWMP